MLQCCFCMLWVHSECCGVTKGDLKYFGVYSCSECKLNGKQVRYMEKQLSDMHVLKGKEQSFFSNNFILLNHKQICFITIYDGCLT